MDERSCDISDFVISSGGGPQLCFYKGSAPCTVGGESLTTRYVPCPLDTRERISRPSFAELSIPAQSVPMFSYSGGFLNYGSSACAVPKPGDVYAAAAVNDAVNDSV
jgi:hypothetical protein